VYGQEEKELKTGRAALGSDRGVEGDNSSRKAKVSLPHEVERDIKRSTAPEVKISGGIKGSRNAIRRPENLKQSNQ